MPLAVPRRHLTSPDYSWGGKSHCRVGLLVVTDPYNFMLIYNFIAVFAAKHVHAEFQVCFSFPFFFLTFFSLFLNFFFILHKFRSLPAAMLGGVHISTLK